MALQFSNSVNGNLDKQYRNPEKCSIPMKEWSSIELAQVSVKNRSNQKRFFLRKTKLRKISDVFDHFRSIFSDQKSVEDSNGIFYSIRINDIIVHIEQNKDPRTFENVKVYAG